MPQATRFDKKTTKIAYKIMGTPANIRSEQEKTSKQKKIDKKLVFDETTRVR